MQGFLAILVIIARPDDTSSRPLSFRAFDYGWLVPFNSRAPVVTECIVKNRKKFQFLKVYHLSIGQYFLDVKPGAMQAVIA